MGVGTNIAHMTEAAASRGHERSVAMTPPQDRTDVGRHHTPPEHTPRLRLKPAHGSPGFVQGGWWPLTDQLYIELRHLLAAALLEELHAHEEVVVEERAGVLAVRSDAPHPCREVHHQAGIRVLDQPAGGRPLDEYAQR